MKSNFTKDVIVDSFISLLNYKTYSKIRIIDILDLCGLSRNVFYNYYHNKADLIERFFERNCIDLYKNPDKQDFEVLYERIGKIIESNKTAFQNIASIEIPNDLHSALYRIFYTLFNRNPVSGKINGALDSYFIDSIICSDAHLSVYSIVYWIIDNGCSAPLSKYYIKPKNLFICNSPYYPALINSALFDNYVDNGTATVKQKIYDSLKVLTRNKPITDVTIKEISAHCGITRNGFYYYFKDIWDLLLSFYIDNVSKYFYYCEPEVAYSAAINFLYDNRTIFSPVAYDTFQNSFGSYLVDCTFTSVRKDLLSVHGIEEPYATRISKCLSQAVVQTLRPRTRDEVRISPDIYLMMEKSIPDMQNEIVI